MTTKTDPRPFGGPQVVGYGYAWRLGADGMPESTRTTDGRRIVVKRFTVNPPRAFFAKARFGNRAGRVF